MTEANLSDLQRAIYLAGLKGPVTEEVFISIFDGLGKPIASYATLVTTIHRLNKLIAPKKFISSGSPARNGGISAYSLVLPEAND